MGVARIFSREHFSKFQNFLKKIAKMDYFSIFSKNLANHALIFCAFGRKTQFNGNFESFLKQIAKKSISLAYFSKKFNKPCINFLRVWTKNANCWEFLRKFWNFYRKIEFFIFILENLLLKIQPSEITPFFYNNFFFFWGGVPPPPGYAPGNTTPYLNCLNRKNWKSNSFKN